jgi:CheY-like chemotaxis protein
MTAILGWSKLLGEDLDEESQAAAVDAIQKSSAAQAQLIEDLLDVSRITAGKMVIDHQPTELSAVVKAAVSAVAPAATAKNVNVQVDTPSDPIMVSGDHARLQQIVWNLVSNAVKFTPHDGKVEVKVAIDDGEAMITVRDTGQGIESEFLPFVFDRFRQADSSTTRAYTGLGLGLAIVRHLVEMHHGSVKALSDGPGSGSTFVVRIPLLADGVAREERRAGRNDTTALRGSRILIVDDEKEIRDYAAAVFRASGSEIQCADSADRALALLEQWKPDVIVTDIGMPGKDGYEFLRAIRSSPALQSMPVIALTAYARPEDMDRAREAGFEAFVAKPVTPADLRAAVGGVLARTPVAT